MIGRLLRTIGLTIAHEGRLLRRDPVVLAMLLAAPVVIITVAGYSLGALYGDGGRIATLAVVDHDEGAVGTEMLDALSREPGLRIDRVPDLAQARRLAGRGDHAPVALEIPAGTSAAIERGDRAPLVAWVDPARRIETNAVLLALAGLCRRVDAEVRARAQQRVAATADRLRHAADETSAAIVRERAATVARLHRVLADERRTLERRLRRARNAAHARAAARVATMAADADAARRTLHERLTRQRDEAAAARDAFTRWLADLQRRAGTHAADVPPPPALPALPSDADLAALAAPIVAPSLDDDAPAIALPDFGARLDAALTADPAPLPPALGDARRAAEVVLPGGLDVVERPAIDGAPIAANAFDQYVPGFGVTFLLIGMMLGISLTLFDERDWGTLERLQASGAPVAGILIGKVLARLLVGVVQMVVLFGVGHALFGISLGRQPAALLLPTVAMAFAAAALGLLVPTIARAHDSVMPLGTMTSLALSAVGGCWWPIEFEPGWLHAVARWLPTTWTMQAYNDLMIRRLPPAVVLWPCAATMAVGAAFLVVGILATPLAHD